MMLHAADLESLRHAALEIFFAALKEVDAGRALAKRVRLNGPYLTVFDTSYNLEASGAKVYSIAIGKAALAMAASLDDILGDRLSEGIAAAPSAPSAYASPSLPSSRWRIFAGGHPLPNQESLDAAGAAIELLGRADESGALVLFLISGGGSAAFELPRDASITLEDLRQLNRALVSCGATIAEINSVRRSISAVKGGRLTAFAPRARQISLIVSDTNPGEESTVASGPTFAPRPEAPSARDVVKRYQLEQRLPSSVLRSVMYPSTEDENAAICFDSRHYLLLDNRSAIEAARQAATARGFVVEVAEDIIEHSVRDGCAELLSRLYAGRTAVNKEKVFCLISGGEFACPVRGAGCGGRNTETVLRAALSLENHRNAAAAHTIILSAGTDGVDGNSPAAGAIADETAIKRAGRLGMDARRFLEQSDSYAFFYNLGDAIVTGPTGTNVRDLRIMIAA